MDTDSRPAAPFWRDLIPLPTVVALTIVAWYIWRDGFSRGDLLAGAATWLALFAALAAIGRLARR